MIERECDSASNGAIMTTVEVGSSLDGREELQNHNCSTGFLNFSRFMDIAAHWATNEASAARDMPLATRLAVATKGRMAIARRLDRLGLRRAGGLLLLSSKGGTATKKLLLQLCMLACLHLSCTFHIRVSASNILSFLAIH
jgi:hypothetical protein